MNIQLSWTCCLLLVMLSMSFSSGQRQLRPWLRNSVKPNPFNRRVVQQPHQQQHHLLIQDPDHLTRRKGSSYQSFQHGGPAHQRFIERISSANRIRGQSAANALRSSSSDGSPSNQFRNQLQALSGDNIERQSVPGFVNFLGQQGIPGLINFFVRRGLPEFTNLLVGPLRGIAGFINFIGPGIAGFINFIGPGIAGLAGFIGPGIAGFVSFLGPLAGVIGGVVAVSVAAAAAVAVASYAQDQLNSSGRDFGDDFWEMDHSVWLEKFDEFGD